MRVTPFAATALLAIGALGASTGTAHAGPAAPEASVRAAEQGIGYVAEPTADSSGVVATLDEGSFQLTKDATAVVLADTSGRAVATLPLAVQAFGTTSALAPSISDTGRSLTLTPVDAPRSSEHIAELVDDAADTEVRKQHNAGIGALVGAGIGAVLGFFLGGVGALLTVPIGAGVGALIGYATP